MALGEKLQQSAADQIEVEEIKAGEIKTGEIKAEEIKAEEIQAGEIKAEEIKNEEIEKLRNVDIRTIKKEDLVDIQSITIDQSLPAAERAAEFARKVRNPYCYRVGDIIVKNVYPDHGPTLKECFENYARTL